MEGFMFIMIIVVIGVILYSIFHSQQVTESWSEAARALKLTHQPGGLMNSRKITGNIDDCFVMVDTITRRSGKNSTTYTRYSVGHPRALRIGLQLRKQGFFSGIAIAFGAQDIKVGDSHFDSMVVVKGNNPEAVRQFLTPDRRKQIQRAMSEFDGLEINDTGFQTESRGQENSSQNIIRTIQRLVNYANSISDAPAAPAKPAPSPSPPPSATLHAAAAEAAVEMPEPEPEPTLTLSEIATALFGDNCSVSEIERKFASEYAGRTIEGNGTLRDWQTTDFDFVFGAGPCIKATVDISISNSGSFGRNNLQAIVRLPADAPTAAIGSNFAFRGQLLKVEGLMRNLFVHVEDS